MLIYHIYGKSSQSKIQIKNKTQVTDCCLARFYCRDKIFKSTEFGWQMQLRYYWDDVIEDCVVRQTNASFAYAYEYLGAQPRLVITPLTDRCYMTLTGTACVNLGNRFAKRWPQNSET